MTSPRRLEFLVLGPLEVRAGGTPVELGPRKQRAVLAILLLARGAVVARERLIDELWGDEPPASAAKSVQIYVSNLRKRLGDGVIVTRGRGYALAVPPETVDVQRFDALAGEGRRLLAAGEPAAAAERLRAALALWRGPELADLAGDPAVEAEAARLEEARLVAVEDAVDAELALGHHESIVPELGRLVREHPLRERLRAQLMLALYRSGRQADALAVYRDGERTLRDELGLRPSSRLRDLERAMLTHDPALEVPTHANRAGAKRRPGRAWLPVAAAGVVAAALGAAAVFAAARGGSPDPHVAANSVALIDPRTNAVAGEVRVGGVPRDVAVGEDGVWVANLQDQVVARIDPETRAVTRTYAVGAAPDALAAARGAVWVGSASRDEVVRIDHRRDRLTRIRIGGRQSRPCSSSELPSLQTRFPVPLALADLVVVRGALWFVCPTHALARIEPRRMEASLVPYEGRLPIALAAGPDALWVANLDAETVTALDPVTGEERATISAPGQPSGVAFAGGSVWVSACRHDAVWRIRLGERLDSPRTIEQVRVGAAPKGVAPGAGAVWVANSGDGTVSRIDAATGEIAATVRVGHRPSAVAFGDGFVWVAAQRAAPWQRGCTYP